MKLEDQVCSLDLAKRLKELGARQMSLYCWKSYRQISGPWKLGLRDPGLDGNFQFFAFTVAEIGEVLPQFIWCSKRSEHGDWLVRKGNTHGAHFEYADTEADARAKMIVYLLENNFIAV